MTTKLSDLRKKLCDYPDHGDQKHSIPDCFERVEVSDLVEALQAEGVGLEKQWCVVHGRTFIEVDAAMRCNLGTWQTCRPEPALVVPLGEDA